MTAAPKVPAWLGEAVEVLGPLAEGFIRRAMANHSDELPADVRERVRSIIAPALERGEASAAAIDDDIAATKARIAAKGGAHSLSSADDTSKSSAIEVGDDDDGDAS